MSNALNRALFRAAGPMVAEKIKELIPVIKEYKASIELEENETHIAAVVHEEYGQLFFVICAFEGNTITRKIKVNNQAEILKLIANE